MKMAVPVLPGFEGVVNLKGVEESVPMSKLLISAGGLGGGETVKDR